MAGLTRYKLNKEVARYHRDHPIPYKPAPYTRSSAYHSPHPRIRDRLSEEGIAELIAAFKSGVSKHILTGQYGIGMQSLQNLLRKHGVKRRSRYDRPQ
jgi:hypothetical protein